MHHQHSDTDADPRDINRGNFYAHMMGCHRPWAGCSFGKDQPVKDAGLPSKDLLEDPIVHWNKRLNNPVLCSPGHLFASPRDARAHDDGWRGNLGGFSGGYSSRMPRGASIRPNRVHGRLENDVTI